MASRLMQTTYRENGDVLHEFLLDGYQVFLLQPANDIQSNLINYGFTGPTLTVFPDRKLTSDELSAYAADCGLLTVSKKSGTGIIFVNPQGDTWADAPDGAYEAVTANLGIAQANFRDGLAVMKDDTVPDEVTYKILGSCVRMYVYGIGSGASPEHILLQTRKLPNGSEIVIEDDGMGFDPENITKGPHTGIENVKKRLSLMCKGTLTIESVPGKGTKTTIFIPAE